MKRYDNFGDYMFDLLFAPLKKGKEAANQFRIFFRVIGKDFDDVKESVLPSKRRGERSEPASPGHAPGTRSRSGYAEA